MNVLKEWMNFSTPYARRIVRNVLLTAENKHIGLDTREIYQRAIKAYPNATTLTPPPYRGPRNAPHVQPRRPIKPRPDPPQREHPIRSMRYLKNVVLEEMAKAKEVEKIHVKVGSPTSDGKHELVVHTQVVGQTDLAGDNPIRECWRWRLLPKYATREFNYPRIPIFEILIPKVARRWARRRKARRR